MNSEAQTILLADDSPDNLKLIIANLEENGCELVVAVDGLEALSLAQRVHPDLILLDVMMPGMDGFEVCRRLKTLPAFNDVPVIFMTSLSMPRDKLDGFAAGAVDYLVKPLQLDEVRARVQAHLRLRALQRQLETQNTELRANETRLRQSRDLLRALAARNDEQHERERRDIARKIHEDLAQRLLALRFGLTTLGAGVGETDQIAAMRQTIDDSIRKIREMVATLRPTVLDMGIAAAMHWLVRDFQQGIGLAFEVEIDDNTDIADETVTFFFRAARELLVNVALHAAAQTVWLKFGADGKVCRLTIRDNGRGFDPGTQRRDALGLAHLDEQTRQHGGHLSIVSSPGRGTTIEIRLPLTAGQEVPAGEELPQ